MYLFNSFQKTVIWPDKISGMEMLQLMIVNVLIFYNQITVTDVIWLLHVIYLQIPLFAFMSLKVQEHFNKPTYVPLQCRDDVNCAKDKRSHFWKHQDNLISDIVFLVQMYPTYLSFSRDVLDLFSVLVFLKTNT